MFTGTFVTGTRTYIFPIAYTNLPVVMRSGCYKADGTSTTYFEGVKTISLTDFSFSALESAYCTYDLYISIGF